MFHTIITLAYIIPNIYVFLRIRQLFINRDYLLYYSLIYILFALVYPFGNLFHESGTGFLIASIGMIGNLFLPFFLYLFLLFLSFDLFLLINKPFKFITPERLKSKRFRTIGLSAIILFSTLVVIAGVINFNTIRISEYKIEIPRKSSKIDHLKIAFVADFHLRKGSNIHFVERFVNKINGISPDLMVYGGDMLEGDKEDENMTGIEKLLKEIKTKYGVFAVLGNHEYYGGQDKGTFFDKVGIKVLCDTIFAIDSSFNLGGRFDSHFRKRKSIESIMKSATETLPLILVDHRPTEIDQVSRTITDVQLSGHTHNGQLFPINLIMQGINKLCWGYKKFGNTHFFVTSGIQLWGPPVRTTGKSEIMVIDITFTEP